MIKITMLSRSLNLMFAGFIPAGLLLFAQPVLAQQVTDTAGSADATPVQRVEITGSSIKRLANENALPVTTIKAEDFAKQGLVTAEQVLNTLSNNQSAQGSSQAVGVTTGGESQADLRGIGSNKTLVLLNGRRLAAHPYDGNTVDLNIIPMAALEKVEILRDGASAIYGTDAIGGVINFITKRSVKGVQLTLDGTHVQEAGGGSEKRINALAGFGDLDQDGFNIFGVVDYHHQSELPAINRAFSATGVIPSKGMSNTSGNTPTANYYDIVSGLSGNVSAPGCDPLNHSYPNTPPDGTCRFDYSALVDDIPETQQASFFTKGSVKINSTNTATVEYLHTDSWNINRIAPAPLYDTEDAALTGLQVPVGSIYYPGGSGGVPAVTGLTGPLSLSWRPLQAGQRAEKDVDKSDRLVLGMEGTVAGWDYKAGLIFAKADATSTLTGGFLTDSSVFQGITGTKQVLGADGKPMFDSTGLIPVTTPLPGGPILNPFGAQTTAGLAYMNANQLLGQIIGGKTKSTGVDFKASREFGELPGGPMGIAFGGEFRRDHAEYDVNTAVASQAASTGLANAVSTSGDRDISAVFTEFDAPLTTQLDMQLAGRFDNYSDVGSTFNPKLGLRYQPAKQLMIRASASTGFRAPSLYEKNQPVFVSNTQGNYDDPTLCPGGTAGVGGTGTAINGANPNVVCNAQQNLLMSGNKDLKPEKAKNYSLGIVVEPISQVTMSVDYWNIHITDSIGALTEATLFGDPAKYANLFVYNSSVTSLIGVTDINQNLGDKKTDGFDVGATYRLPATALGNFMATIDGTYVNKFEYQTYKNGPWNQNVGTFGDLGPVFRWKHNLAIDWSQGDWGVTLVQRYLSGYHDQNLVDPMYAQDVKAYSVWSLSTTYNGMKNLSVTAGVKNLLNTAPGFTNQGITYQQGFDPRYTDPTMRSFFMRATYKFM